MYRYKGNNDLKYKQKVKSPDETFDKYDNALDLIDKILYGEISLAETKNDQKNFRSSLGEIKRRNTKKK